MEQHHNNMRTDTNVYYLGDFRGTMASNLHASLLPRNRANEEYETPRETAIRFALLLVTAAVVLFAAYQA